MEKILEHKPAQAVSCAAQIACASGAPMAAAVQAVRRRTGLSQALFAQRFGIPIGTLRDWEQNGKQPDGPARTLLRIIGAEAEMVQRALGSSDPHHPGATGSQQSNPLDAYVTEWLAERPDTDVADFLFKAAFTLIGFTIESEFRELARGKLGVSEGELRILLALRRSKPNYSLRQVELLPHLLVTSGAVTKQVQRLEKRGLVQRRTGIGGGRNVSIQLTDKGHRLVTAAFEQSATAFTLSAPAFRNLSEQERASGIFFIKQVFAGIEQERSRRQRMQADTARLTLRKPAHRRERLGQFGGSKKT